MIKCILLNAHCTLIAEVVEVDAEIGDPNCKLIKIEKCQSNLLYLNQESKLFQR